MEAGARYLTGFRMLHTTAEVLDTRAGRTVQLTVACSRSHLRADRFTFHLRLKNFQRLITIRVVRTPHVASGSPLFLPPGIDAVTVFRYRRCPASRLLPFSPCLNEPSAFLTSRGEISRTNEQRFLQYIHSPNTSLVHATGREQRLGAHAGIRT